MDQSFTAELREAIQTADFAHAIGLLQTVYLEQDVKDFNAYFTSIMVDEYSSFRSDGLALLLENILGLGENIGTYNLPNNDVFRLCFFKGSWELYECYREVVLDDHMSSLEEEDAWTLEMELQAIANNLFKMRMDNYTPLILGNDFNAGVSLPELPENMVALHIDDRKTILAATEHFNTIQGMWKILKDLEERVDEE